jgi:plasmid stabilization system protein ParE
MSVPSMRLIFAPEANDDLIDIQSYTELTYRGRLNDAFTLLSEHPYIGSTCDELPAHYRVFPVEQHRIIYFVTADEDSVNVVRILHRSRDILRHI